MKQKIFYGMLLMALMSSLSLTSKANNTTGGVESVAYSQTSGDNGVPDDARPITVYLIVGTNTGVPKSAQYSRTSNRIYIKEGKYVMNYNVRKNPYYGQESAKGSFQYVASNYFFDL